MIDTETTFYAATGGTLGAEAPSYITRQADTDLSQALQQGEYCYVLTSRQMGKSSLIVRVAQQLRAKNIRVAVLDLTKLASSNTTARLWYRSLLEIVSKQLGFKSEMVAFWKANDELDDLYRWMQALQQVVLSQCVEPVVICLDEIDSLQTLPFSTDEFFAAIRECFNARAQTPELQRLTFCLIGVVTPSELIKEGRITPFNIGRRIDVTDFTVVEMMRLAQGLGREEKLARALLQRIFYWTNGQPYLTQKLCQAVAEDKSVTRPAGVDKVCEELFFDSRARDTETHLQHVRTQMLRPDRDQVELLDLYKQVRQQQQWRWPGLGKRVKDDDTNPIINALRLAGLVRVWENYLWVRNRIYFRVFDKAWIEANLPDAEKRRQRAAFFRGVIRASVAATGIIAAIGGGIYWYWDGYVREIDTYCNRFVKRYGLPQCVGELTQAQVQKMTVSYKLIQNGRKNPVYKVQAITGMDQSIQKGQIFQNVGEIPIQRQDVRTYFETPRSYMVYQNSSDPKVQWEFVLDTQGKIVYEKAFNKQGDLLMGLVYSPLMATQLARAHYVGTEGFPERSEGAEFVEIEYDTNGYEKTLRYFDRQHQPQPGLCGAFKVERQLDERGLIITEAFFDANGQPFEGQSKDFLPDFDAELCRYHKKVTHYDEYGNESEISFFGTDEQPSVDVWGAHKIVFRYDERGNQSEAIFFNVNAKPLQTKAVGHRWKALYDDSGREVEIAVFDIFGNLCWQREIFEGFSGRIFEWANFNADGKPYNGEHGYHRMTTRRNNHGNVIEEAYFDAEGKPTLNDKGSGYHKLVNRYNEKGQHLEEAYFDAKGKPTLNNDKGYHKQVNRYDENGKHLEEAYFDAKGKPTLNNDKGYHKQVNRYDENGKHLEEAYFDAEGKPTLNRTNGYHKQVNRYNEKGQHLEEAYFDAKGKPTLNNDKGYHKQVNRYDEKERRIEESHFDVFGNLTDKEDGNGHLLEIAYFDTEGKPIFGKDGYYHKQVNRYNENGKPIEWAYFGKNGQPILLEDGYHKFTDKYDDRGNVIEQAYFGLDGQPILHQEGYHKLTGKYDDRGNVIELAFGLNGKPVLDKSNGTHKLIKKYDDPDNITEKAYFDVLGNPTTTTDGFHKLTAKYDDKGNQIEGAYFDVTGRPLTVEVVVKLVKPDSQAEKLGLQAGDIFTHYDGKPVINLTSFIDRRDAESAEGMAKELKVLREGKELTLPVLPGELGVELENRVKSK